ncbi:MAG: hypothetical protein MUC64_08605 [Rubritepida sp.]|nr:hypothetical protein [Rubritepida sp.]
MSRIAAAWLVEIALLYAAIGLGLGLTFLTRAVERFDPAARGAYAFRILLLPGLALLWPYVAWRWWRGR